MKLFEAGTPTLHLRELAEAEALRARRIESVYHAGQAKAWDGRQVLQDAYALYPRDGARLGDAEKRALAGVFSVLMWGELAAWRVSAQLVELLEDPAMRLAATGQTHDEARHYYVLHDYLRDLAVEVPPLDAFTRTFLNACLAAPLPLQKVVGMQLLVETIALTIFKMVREVDVDPALSHLLTFYERDEARHVGFGVQAAPVLMAQASALERARLLAFEGKVLSAMLLSVKNVEEDLRRVGADPRALLEDGARRFAQILADYRALAGNTSPEGRVLARLFDAMMDGVFPTDRARGVGGRAKDAWAALWRPSRLG
ncbi:MAG: ferritin-like domain-containing protein [Deltaproteobacteria bacterium]|nr:ferritin-like domain-containing protein [Deltaproteobacteria bacterium]